jgi:hypothetical protein
MTKYKLAKEQIAQTLQRAQDEGFDEGGALEALIVTAIETIKTHLQPGQVRDMLQVEIDNLGSGGFYEIQKR